MLFFFLFILLGHACSVRPQDQKFEKNIFILAGQSNMAGRGGVVNDTATGITTWDGIVPHKCRPNPSVLRFSANLIWVEAHEPLHADIDTNKTNGIGPGMAFAHSILAKDKTFGLVGLVPCAIGGTNISQWERGKFLYKQMMGRAKASLQNGGTIRGLLWYQGESDTEYKEDAELYKKRMDKFFSDVRDDLQSPLLPIIQVALASGLGPYTETVREAQLGIDLLNLRTIEAKGLPLQPDGVHLSSAAQVRLGLMMADAFLQFVPSPSPIRSVATRSFSNFTSDYFFLPFVTFLIIILTFLYSQCNFLFLFQKYPVI